MPKYEPVMNSLV